MYVAVPTLDFDALLASETLLALLQAEAAFVGQTETHTILSCEYAPDGELWRDCGLTIDTYADSRDKVERWLGHLVMSEALGGVAEAAEEAADATPGADDSSAHPPDQPTPETDTDEKPAVESPGGS